MRTKAYPLDSLAPQSSKLMDYWALTKPRLLTMVLLSAALGFSLSSQAAEMWLLLNLLLGTALVGAAAHALNQWYERIPDGQMPRTRNRPLPAGRLGAEEALRFGMILMVLGLLYLQLTVNSLTAIIGALTLASYVLLYTPLKQVTALNTWVGAVTGALPPLMGWAAAEGQMTWQMLPIFALLYFWQLPHFFAIAWAYREDYARGGFRMLSLDDERGTRTARQILVNTLFMIVASFSFLWFEQASTFYIFSASILGGGFLLSAVMFWKRPSVPQARYVFLASIVYLPLLATALVVDNLFL
jgi:protoheme IX farnesyltransferase